TGDLAKYDEDGDFYIVGRKKDMIISGGENIYPQEIEQYLYNYETISEAAVIGVTDIKWGEIAVAFFSTTDGASIQDQVLNAYCQQYLGKYKIPKKFIQLDNLPKTDVGKIDKNKLKTFI